MSVKSLGKKTLPLIVLGALLLVAYLAMMNPPETDRQTGNMAPKITVQVITAKYRPYQISIESYGTVRPRTQSMLVSQVSGLIVWINPQFRDGGFFSAGEPLLRIDPRDYEADVRIAEAGLLNAQQALAEEQARAAQAKQDWERLEDRGQAPDLVLRKPQLLAAQAQVISAESGLTKAKLNLERTEVTAPFDGRVFNNLVDLGQVVSSNSQLGQIYATDYVEIRLPVRNNDLVFIDLPESQLANRETKDTALNAQIISSLGTAQVWPSKIIRTEGAIDESARQLHVVAQVEDPFGVQTSRRKPLKIGEYVTAKIEGAFIQQALVIPNSTIYQGSYVYVVEGELLKRRNIGIRWQNASEAVVDYGLEPGDMIVTTPLGQVTSGTSVNLASGLDEPPVSANDRNQPDQQNAANHRPGTVRS